MLNGKQDTTDENGLPVSMAGIGTHEIVLDLFRRFLPESVRVLDLAAGQGAFSIKLRELGHAVQAVDVSSEHWKVPNIPITIADLDTEFAESILDGDNKFDALVAIEIIEHLENPFRFIRECAKLLRPGGLLFLTSPNVEAMNSRLLFLYTGRLNGFGAYETVRPAHITPIFKWKLDMMLDEARFKIVHEGFNRVPFDAGGMNLKPRIASVIGRILSPIVKGEKGGEGRIVVGQLTA